MCRVNGSHIFGDLNARYRSPASFAYLAIGENNRNASRIECARDLGKENWRRRLSRKWALDGVKPASGSTARQDGNRQQDKDEFAFHGNASLERGWKRLALAVNGPPPQPRYSLKSAAPMNGVQRFAHRSDTHEL